MSKVKICNDALAFIGMAPLASLDENRPPAMYCRQFYHMALQEVLRDHAWNFAEERRLLAAVKVPPAWASEYTHAYAVPENCLMLLWLIDSTGVKSRNFRVATDNERNLVFGFFPRATGAYTAMVTDVSRFDPLFRRALTHKLQGYLVKPLLKNNTTLIREATELYAQAIAKAKARDAQEGQRLQEGSPFWDGGHEMDWVDARLSCWTTR